VNFLNHIVLVKILYILSYLSNRIRVVEADSIDTGLLHEGQITHPDLVEPTLA
jgi:hypothetical protein